MFGEGHDKPLWYSCLEKSHGQRSLLGCSPWGRWESDTTERLHFHFSLSYIGEGNDNLLQCSCLENVRDRGAWWAAIYGVAQSRTRLKWLSRSSIYLYALSLIKLLNFRSGFPGGSDGKASAYNAGDLSLTPGSGRFPWRRKWQPTLVFLPGKSCGWSSLAGYGPWGRKESDMTEQPHFHFPSAGFLTLFFSAKEIPSAWGIVVAPKIMNKWTPPSKKISPNNIIYVTLLWI